MNFAILLDNYHGIIICLDSENNSNLGYNCDDDAAVE